MNNLFKILEQTKCQLVTKTIYNKDFSQKMYENINN